MCGVEGYGLEPGEHLHRLNHAPLWQRVIRPPIAADGPSFRGMQVTRMRRHTHVLHMAAADMSKPASRMDDWPDGVGYQRNGWSNADAGSGRANGRLSTS